MLVRHIVLDYMLGVVAIFKIYYFFLQNPRRRRGSSGQLFYF